ncbi:hypothetical protein ARMGADRAFT_960212 [Armillaria gallica]|uniref:Fungal-type protein kinase domain-containing protein n=1 Tax=Armillaria gallica TaxID=47427 RepID=A0A2H3DTK4_ARMGA|nr:hypothetical protein ARMGADRAFT_960212 [Armillaria gallica]
MQTIDFVSFLKTLLAKMLLGVSTDGKDTVALKSDANELFDKMLKDAIGFCNSNLTTSAKTSPRSKLSQEIKTNLKEFFQRKSETYPYLLSTAINTIMLAYDGHHFGQLPCLSGSDRIIVIPSDPLVIESKEIKRDLPNGKCKPDNIIVQLSHLLKLDDTRDYQAWIQSIGTESNEWKRARKDAGDKTSWLEVHCSLELKAHRVIECAPLDQPMSEQQVLCGTSSTPASDVLQYNDAKSESDCRLASQASGSSTRSSSRSSEKKRSHAEVAGLEYACKMTSSQKKCKTSDLDERFTAKTQCAYYAIERLRAAWNITHSIVLLLDDNMLSIHWYDAEGCIMTQPIDIIGQLPLFVVLVIVFQRFDAAMWGLPDIQISQTTENRQVSFYLESDKTERTRFQLVGHRTFGADAWLSPLLDCSEQSTAPQGLHNAISNAPIPTSAPPCPGSMPTLPMRRRWSRSKDRKPPPNTSSTVTHQGSRAFPGSTREPQSLFFEAAWSETSQNKKPGIIADSEAISRANQYLDEVKMYVLEHIPTVVSWQEVKHTSTGNIRQLLGLSSERSRTLLWMVSHKLDPIVDLHKLPNDLKAPAFWKAFWELIRCHYLLWRIGIVHGDISLSNLMYDAVTEKAILNDFDLAAIVNPGDKKKGFERTGMKPVMALELLKKAKGEVQRKYRHDLESFAWCLLWCAMAEPFPKRVIHGSLTDAYVYKYVMAHDRRGTAKSGFEQVWKFVEGWFNAWVERRSKEETLRTSAERFIARWGEFALNDPLRWVLRSKDEDEDRNSLRCL